MNVDWGQIITLLLATIITGFLPFILGNLALLVNAKFKTAAAKIPAEKLNYIIPLLKNLVLAAEQSGLTGALSKAGADKKAFVLEKAQAALKAQGYNIDLGLLDTLVEGVVYEAFNKVEVPAEFKEVVTK